VLNIEDTYIRRWLCGLWEPLADKYYDRPLKTITKVHEPMNYETIYLDIGVNEAKCLISERRLNYRIKSTGSTIKYYTNAGHLLATLSDSRSSEKGKSKLRYRTAIISGHHVHARTTARKIRDAVKDHRVSSI
jgi:hypothetical protein